MQKKIKKQLLAIGGFVVVFGTMIWFGYKNFVKSETKPDAATNGLNNKLPVAETHKELNKLEQYIQAEKDSLARKQQQANDPYSKAVSKQEAGKKSHKESPTPVAKNNSQTKSKTFKQSSLEAKRPDFEIQYPLNVKSTTKNDEPNNTPSRSGGTGSLGVNCG